MEEGTHAKEVPERLGHASIVTTMEIYGHLMPGLGAKLDEALKAARRNAVEAQSDNVAVLR